MCKDLIDLEEAVLCKTFIDLPELNFYYGLNSSNANTLVYTTLWLVFMVLWPLRHYANREALALAKLDLLLHRLHH